MSEIATASVVKIPDPLKNWGFLRTEDRRGYIFYHVNDVTPDEIGRRYLKVGATVRCNIESSSTGLRARNIVEMSADIDPTTHRECSFLYSWNSEIKPAQGWLRRETGDSLVLFDAGIPDFEKIKCHLRSGLWVFHGVACSRSGKFYAIDANIHLPGINDADFEFAEPEPELTQPIYKPGSAEAFFAALPETGPDEPERLPKSTVVSDPAPLCLQPQYRKKSLRELAAVL